MLEGMGVVSGGRRGDEVGMGRGQVLMREGENEDAG